MFDTPESVRAAIATLSLPKVFSDLWCGNAPGALLTIWQVPKKYFSAQNHWSSPRPPYTTAVITSAAEQKAIIEAIAPLIEHKEPNWRWTSVQTLLTVSRPYDANLKSLTSKQAIPALVAAYRVEENVHARSAMAEAIRRLEDEAFWQKLTRNPQGIVVTTNFREVQRESLHFELSLQHTRAKITEVPQFHFVRTGVDVEAESLMLEPQMIYPKNMFREGWESSRGGVHVAIPLAKVPPGRWQITVRGKIGEESWNADPIELKLPLPEKE